MKDILVVFIDAGNCPIGSVDVEAYTFEHALAKAREWYVNEGLPVADIERVEMEIVYA